MHHPASWYRTSDRHLAANLGRVGTLMVWRDSSTSTGTWSTFVLGTQLTGFVTAAAAQTAGMSESVPTAAARESKGGSRRAVSQFGISESVPTNWPSQTSPCGQRPSSVPM